MPTFAENFSVGDVVYGLSQSRAPYINSLGNDLRRYCEESGAFLLCDSFNNRSFLGVNAAYGIGPGVNPVNTITNPATVAEIDHNLNYYEQDLGMAALSGEEKATVKAYFDALDASARSPKKAAGAPATKWTRKGDATVTMLMIRRACKFGIEYVITRQNRSVHFVLDVPFHLGVSMDMADIVAKAKYAGGVADPQGSVPITFSELRCCYRNRNQWIPTGRLKFYLNLQEVQPPWLTNPVLWNQYEQARYKKHHPVKAFFHI